MLKLMKRQNIYIVNVIDETIKNTMNNPFSITDVRYTNPNLRI